MSSPAIARAALERPYQREADARVVEIAERKATMPKDLGGLLQWFQLECSTETPDALHGSQVWRDRVTAAELEDGVNPVGASETGALAYADDFRRRIENGPSEVDHGDEDAAVRSGRVYFKRPVQAALSRIARRGRPLMARHLQLLAWAGFDWRKRADASVMPLEIYEVYIRQALIELWREHRDWVRSD